MKVTIEVYPIRIVDGEDVPTREPTEGAVLGMIREAIDHRLADLNDSRRDFVFISTRPRDPRDDR